MKILVEITKEEIEFLKQLKNYFGEHDKILFEHKAYPMIDNLVKKLNKPAVINNEVMKCSCGKESSTPLCFECFKKGLKRENGVSVCCPYKHDCNELKHYKKCNERCSMYKQTDL